MPKSTIRETNIQSQVEVPYISNTALCSSLRKEDNVEIKQLKHLQVIYVKQIPRRLYGRKYIFRNVRKRKREMQFVESNKT